LFGQPQATGSAGHIGLLRMVDHFGVAVLQQALLLTQWVQMATFQGFHLPAQVLGQLLGALRAQGAQPENQRS